MKNNNNCDIIIYDFDISKNLKQCINQVIQNTNLDSNCLYVIYNEQRSAEIKSSSFAKNAELCNIHLISENCDTQKKCIQALNGIVKNSNNNLVLLSGDTVVSKGWFEKINGLGNLRNDIGIVAPMSNDFIFESIPSIFDNKNDINETLLTCNTILENVYSESSNNYIEVPLVSCSCMFIKRSIINKVGLFDEDNFNSFNDAKKEFSLRCQDFGYAHIAALDTYVYRNKDGLDIKNNCLIEPINKQLNNKYVAYSNFLNFWLTNANIQFIKNNLAFISLKFNNRPNVFYLIHDYDTTLGGTTLHVNDLVKYLKSNFNFVIFSWSTKYNCYVATIITQEYKTKVLFNGVAFIDPFKIYSTGFKDLCNSIFDLVNFSIVHVHHFLYSYADILEVAKNHGCETFFTIHDYYSICPSITLLDNNLNCCIDKKEKNCNECLQIKYGFDVNVLEMWQKRWNEVLLKFDNLIAPSDTCKYWMNKYFKDIDIKVIDHGLDLNRLSSNFASLDEHINVGVVGCLRPSKGASLLKKLFSSCNSNKIKFYSFGWSDDSYLSSKHENYEPIGAYKREELQNLLAKFKINVVCLLSIWPETYGYTLDEVAAVGIPVLCFDIGAIAERVKKYQIGWTINCKSNNEDIIDKIISILNNKEEYKRICNNVKKYNIRTAKDMADEYRLLYKHKNNSNIDYAYALKSIERHYLIQKPRLNT